MPQPILPQSRVERMALSGPDKIALVEKALGHKLAADVAAAVAEPECDPKAMIMWLAQAQPRDRQEQTEQFFHDRRAGGW